MAERLGVVEYFSTKEVGLTFAGVLLDSITHAVAESLLDKVFEPKYPDKYALYSTGTATAIHTALGLFLALYGGIRGRTSPYLQYIGWGMVFSEVSSWLDMIRINFELKA